MRALVTGGAGFIGSHLVDALVARGDEVVVVDDLTTGYHDNVNSRARLVVGDVADPAVMAEVVGGVEVVFHLAAARAVLRSVEQPLATDRTNTGGTLNVLEAARRAAVRRVVWASSSSLYGGTGPVPTPESSSLDPRSPYAVSKLAGEHYARIYWELHRLETVSLRLFNVYGPRQRRDSQYAAVIPLFVAALLSARPAEVHGDGHQSRDFTYVDDAVGAFLAAASAPAMTCAGRAYNVAGGQETTVLELLAALEDIVGVNVVPVHVPARPGDVGRSLADCAAAAADLGWAPVVGVDEGLRRTVPWFTQDQASVPARGPNRSNQR
jgi:UDP-glucose 4-epimerase